MSKREYKLCKYDQQKLKKEVKIRRRKSIKIESYSDNTGIQTCCLYMTTILAEQTSALHLKMSTLPRLSSTWTLSYGMWK